MNSTIDEDQAEELRNLINKVEGQTRKQVSEQDDSERDIDILNLPPRKEIHGSSKIRINFKFSDPLLRLILVFLVVIGVIIGAVYLFNHDYLKLMAFLGVS